MDELTPLREAFGPDELPSNAALDRARTALLQHIGTNEIGTREAVSPLERHRRSRRWPVRLSLAAAVAVAAVVGVVGVVAVENLGTVDEQGKGHPVVHGLPFARSASADFLEKAAQAADRKPSKAPRQDQFMYKESRALRNAEELEKKAPNAPLVPGKTRVVVQQDWKRIDGQVWGRRSGGQLVVEQQGNGAVGWAQLPYDELVGLTTPEAVLAWVARPHPSLEVSLDGLLSQYVLPPAVEAAVFRALARAGNARLNPDAVNLDGRPAIGLSVTVEGHLSQELLFDKATYALIGERTVVIEDHTRDALDDTSQIHKGDVFTQVVYADSRIVDRVGDTR
ncbi:CU044_5270 family protein [Micromonospora sp. NPDC005173]|uniref:CU044_5270 family protein n=1 Tax=Micromonospora sp. NPDC005173 TaxID=3157165 RepID=UPI0033A93B9B